MAIGTGAMAIGIEVTDRETIGMERAGATEAVRRALSEVLVYSLGRESH